MEIFHKWLFRVDIYGYRRLLQRKAVKIKNEKSDGAV